MGVPKSRALFQIIQYSLWGSRQRGKGWVSQPPSEGCYLQGLAQHEKGFQGKPGGKKANGPALFASVWGI